MTQACCPSCRLRLARASAAHLEACPLCTQPLIRIASAKDALGYALFDIADTALAVPVASTMALPIPGSPPEQP
jgi:hypothetical protein